MNMVSQVDDVDMDQDEIRKKPDDHVQMRWRTSTKAKYDFLYMNCLSDD
jgi:hypothetical protein